MRYFNNPWLNVPVDRQHQLDRSYWSKFLVEKIDEILRNVNSNEGTAQGGLYTGSPGIGYMLWYICRCCPEDIFSGKQKLDFLARGLAYCQSYLKIRTPEDPDTSFLCGAAGVHVTAALLAKDLGLENVVRHHVQAFSAIGSRLHPTDFFKPGSDEMLMGRAGYLAGAFQLARFIPNSKNDSTLKALYDSTIESGLKYAARRSSACPLMCSYYDTEYLGAAHGLGGILQELLTANGIVHGVSEPPQVRASVDFLLSLKQLDGNFAPAMDEVRRPRPNDDALLHWCHGVPGIIYCLAMAYRRYGDHKYLSAIMQASDLVWERGLLLKGPGICHGVAGNGYVHLLCYRLSTSVTDKQKYLYRAVRFCEFLVSEQFRKYARIPDCPWSLYEGWAGTLCFVVDMLSNPDSSEFPFSNVFCF